MRKTEKRSEWDAAREAKGLSQAGIAREMGFDGRRRGVGGGGKGASRDGHPALPRLR